MAFDLLASGEGDGIDETTHDDAVFGLWQSGGGGGGERDMTLR